jgi:broad specificity phosphatase PhoE
MKRMIPWFAVLLLLIAIVLLSYWYMFAPATTVILVRHAERLNDTDTTSLSAAGWDRAAALAPVVSDAGVTHIFITEKARTRLTASLAANRLNLEPSVIPAADTKRLVDSIRACDGQTMLVVGHSNTIPDILKALDVDTPVEIARTVYDDLFVVTVTPFRASVVRLKYGKPS